MAIFCTQKLTLKIIITYHIYNTLIPQNDQSAIRAIISLRNHCSSCGDSVVIIGGDLNCTDNPAIDRLCMPIEHRYKVSMALKGAVNALSLCDAWRRLNPLEQKCTWLRNNPSIQRAWRFYVNSSVMSSIQTCRIVPCSLSDHSAVTLVIKLPSQNPRASAYWHFNNSLLEDNYYHKIITQFWTD